MTCISVQTSPLVVILSSGDALEMVAMSLSASLSH